MDAIGRTEELRAITRFLDAPWPATLVLAGDPGIGKTTLWRQAVDQARQRGVRVLACQPTAAETQLSCASLADLLVDLEPAVVDTLPEPQRAALNTALLRTTTTHETDQRATAAALLNILSTLAERTPVLLAIDDAQWLDASSAQVITFATRRLTGRVGVLATVRSDAGTWTAHRRTVGPLTRDALHDLLRARTGRTYPRPTLTRIHEISAGNPFYALELARADRTEELPPTLTQLVHARLDGIKPDTRQALLTAAALADPTVELLETALETTPATLDRLLEDAEQWDVIQLDGHHVRFTHPILASGIYAAATAAGRRAVHRRLADTVTDQEERARHLALAAIRHDPDAIAALDAAAELARGRGATAAAAELLELALKLGADTPERRLRLAQHHFDAGDPQRARALLEGTTTAPALRLLATIRLSDDSYQDAAAHLAHALDLADTDLRLRVRIRIELLFVLYNLGRVREALDRTDATVADATALGDPDLAALAHSMVAIVRFLGGQGVSDETLDRVLAFADPPTPTPVVLRPSMIGGLLLSWLGRVDEACERLSEVRRRCLDRGEESDLMVTAFHTTVAECWRGNLADARRLADDAMARARQLGTDLALATGLVTQAHVQAYAGETDAARAKASQAVEIFQRGSCASILMWPTVTLGFVDVSQEDYASAAITLAPLIDTGAGYGEPRTAPFASDAVEALIGAGRLADAEALIDRLPATNHAVAQRCRALLLAARGDLTAAATAATDAVRAHGLRPMPFERARAQLVLGQIQRRRRRRAAAATALTDAAQTFERLGTPLWAARARADLARTTVPMGDGIELTPSERRVAELVAGGMTNREVAAMLFISSRTVEVNLSRIYRKLGIRSRAELGRRMADG